MLDRIDIKYFKMAVGTNNLGKETDSKVNARCPVCGDSHKNKSKKRLDLYKKGTVTNVNCFNGDCPVHNKSMYGFLKEFFPALLAQYKKEQFGTTMEKLAKGDGDVFSNFEKPEPTQTNEVQLHDLTPYLKDIKEVPQALDYIKNRGYLYNEQYGKWYFGYQDLKIGETLYKITNSIVIPLYYNNKMYGFYSRSIQDKTFYTYMHDANIGYKIWNWFNIDKTKPVYIFEGIFDALSSGKKNIIAAIGAKIPDERVSELEDPIFCYDNDRTGLMNAIEMANKGYKVYVQPTIFPEKDMNDFKLKHPDIIPSEIIDANIFQGISAKVRLQGKL